MKGLTWGYFMAHRAPGPGQERPHEKGKGDDAVDVDAHEADGLKVQSDGPHGAAHGRPVDDEKKPGQDAPVTRGMSRLKRGTNRPPRQRPR